MENSKPHYDVVAAVIRHEGRMFCVQRGQTKYPYTSYKFEFPGGKIEEGESDQEALLREIQEELKVEIKVGPRLKIINHEYPDFTVTIKFYRCSLVSDTIQLSEHIKGVWVTPIESLKLDWVEADKGVIGT